MNKRYAHHLYKKITRLSTLYLLMLVILSSGMFVYAYRHNNIEALRLRDAVYAADKAGGDIETALRDLRLYTYSHMNAGLAGAPGSAYPPIQLKYQYERLVKAEQARVATANQKVNQDAQRRCETPGVATQYGSRTRCVEVYLGAYKLEREQQIPDGLYKFDFVSPRWSPDLAGWSLLVAVLFSLILLVRITAAYWLRRQLRAHQ